MKTILLTCLFILGACIDTTYEIKQNIITQEVFKQILKDIHLAEANYEMKKNNDLKGALNNLKNDYANIYTQYSITQNEFDNSINHYTSQPEILEEIYGLILQDLEKEKSTIDH